MKKTKLLASLLFIVVMAFAVTSITSCKKVAGPAGAAGADGTNGADGIDGVDGTNGTNGSNGVDGLNGVDANSFCKTCHNASNWSSAIDALAISKHEEGSSWLGEGNRRDCAKCHSAQGYLETLYTGLDTTVFNHMVGTTSYTSWAGESLGCDVCHTFHGTLDEADFPNYALRTVPGFASLFNKAITLDLGESNLCIRCHQNRPNTSVKIGATTVVLDTVDDTHNVNITSQRYGGHHGPQAQLKAGVGMGDYQVTGSATYTNSTGHVSLGCGDCHVLSTANHTDSIGGHYYKLKNKNSGVENVTVCVTCHAGTTNHDINGVQTAVKAKMLQIETKLIAAGILKNTGDGTNEYGGVNSTGYVLGNDGINNANSTTNPRTLTAKKAKALHAFLCIREDYSYGVHNSKYIQALLTNIYEAF